VKRLTDSALHDLNGLHPTLGYHPGTAHGFERTVALALDDAPAVIADLAPPKYRQEI
jgi:hypothetical protein